MTCIEVKNKHGRRVIINLDQVLCITESEQGVIFENTDSVAITTEETYPEILTKLEKAGVSI